MLEQAEQSKSDELLQRLLDRLDEYTELQSLVAAKLKAGTFDLAQTRYAVGAHRLDRHNYDNRMQAISTIQLEDSEGMHIFSLNHNTKLHNIKAATPPSTIKNRINKEASSTKEVEDGAEIVDPITWFGVLMPQHLANGQRHFKNALSLLIEMANCKQKIEKLKIEYEESIQ